MRILPRRSSRGSIGRGGPDTAAQGLVNTLIQFGAVGLITGGDSVSVSKVVRAGTTGQLIFHVDGGQGGARSNCYDALAPVVAYVVHDLVLLRNEKKNIFNIPEITRYDNN